MGFPHLEDIRETWASVVQSVKSHSREVMGVELYKGAYRNAEELLRNMVSEDFVVM